MNDNAVNKRLFPQRAIIVYHGNGEYHQDYYLESRQIQRTAKGFALMTPTPLSKRTMQEIAGSYLRANEVKMDFDGLIPEHLLFGLNRPGLTAVIWYRPAQTRALNFDTYLQIRGASNVQIPALVYAVVNNRLYIYALMGNVRPDAATKLYKAPFFNIYEDGNVCLGTAPIGRTRMSTFEKEADRFERGFYLAEQNGGQENPCKTPLKKLWPALIKAKRPFPCKKELVAHTKFKTLGAFIDKVITQKKGNE